MKLHKLGELLDKTYVTSKFEDNIELSAFIALGIAFLATGLWILDWTVDRNHAADTIGLRILMGAVVLVYSLGVFLKLRRNLWPVYIVIIALICQLIFAEILNRLDQGVYHEVGGYLYFFLSFTLLSLIYSIRASALLVIFLAVAPLFTSHFGYPSGLDLKLYSGLAFPAAAIVIFIIYIIDVFYLRNYLVQREMQLLSETDTLTGLSNRRHIFQKAEQFLSLARRNQRPFSLLSLDLDFFKQINDTYGHPAGDAALQHTARIFSKALRESDSIGRAGGEEFIALLPDTSIDGAELLANRIVETLAKTPCSWKAAPNGNIPMTVSIGLAGFNIVKDEDTLEKLLLRSDQALYQAKQSGRNRILVWNEKFSAQSISS